MIDHFGINCKDYARSQQFYDRVLGTLGYSRQLDFGEAVGYGPEGHPDFWIAEGASMLRLQRWMGHYSAAYTLETYGHLIDGELGNPLELNDLGIQTGGV